MTRTIIATVILLLTGFWIVYLIRFYPQANNPAAVIVAVLVNIITAPLYANAVEAVYNLRYGSLWFKLNFVYSGQKVRLSCSYLFRIQSKGRYLLVKSNHGNYYQLVGGAYKYFESAKPALNKLGVEDDVRIHTTHGIARKDLRVMVPARRVLKFIDWFNSRKDREISQWREFCEELLTTDILPQKQFRYVDYNFVGPLQTPLKKARNLSCQEILIYEIYDLVLNSDQEAILEALVNQGDTDEFKWASKELIQSLGFIGTGLGIPYQIGAHTKWAINMEWSND